jgi:uncharacterized protein involved in oxidation of intracellular sulfur
MKILFILNDAPYGTEKCYNALRLAIVLLKTDPSSQPTLFVMADAVAAARRYQKTPDSYYKLECMLKRAAHARAEVLLCGTCLNARGIGGDKLVDAARRSTIDELASAAVSAEKGLIF